MVLYCNKGKYFMDTYISETVKIKEVNINFIKSITVEKQGSKNYNFNPKEVDLLLKKCKE